MTDETPAPPPAPSALSRFVKGPGVGLAALVVSVAALGFAVAPYFGAGGSDAQIRSYLLNHPEMLQEMSQALQTKQNTELSDSITRRAALSPSLLAADARDAAFGPVVAKVTQQRVNLRRVRRRLVVCRDAELLHDRAAGCRNAEASDADGEAIEPDVRCPGGRYGGLDRDAPTTRAREHAFLVARALALEALERGQADHARARAETLGGLERVLQFDRLERGAGSDRPAAAAGDIADQLSRLRAAFGRLRD